VTLHIIGKLLCYYGKKPAEVASCSLQCVIVYIVFIHSEPKKLCHYTFARNFDKCLPIFKSLSLSYSP